MFSQNQTPNQYLKLIMLQNKVLKKRKICDKEALGQLEEDKFAIDASTDFSLSIEYSETGCVEICDSQRNKDLDPATPRMYLQCSSSLKIGILRKFLGIRNGLKPSVAKTVDIMYDDRPLSGELTLLDVAYIYAWRRTAPMRLFYRLAKSDENRPVETAQQQQLASTTTAANQPPAMTESSGKPVLMQIDNKMSDFAAVAIKNDSWNGEIVAEKNVEKDSGAENDENCKFVS
jgi:hypothetical protein